MNKNASEKQIGYLKELLEKRLHQHAITLKAELDSLETGGSYAFSFKRDRYDLKPQYQFAHDFVVFSVGVLNTLSSEQASKMIDATKNQDAYRSGIYRLAGALADAMPKTLTQQYVDQQHQAGKLNAETHEIVCEALAYGGNFSLVLSVIEAVEE